MLINMAFPQLSKGSLKPLQLSSTQNGTSKVTGIRTFMMQSFLNICSFVVTLIEFGMFGTKIAENNVQLKPHPAYCRPTLPGTIARNQLAPANFIPEGDPKKAIEKVYELSQLEDPPLHLPLGRDCVEGIKKQLASVSEEVHTYEHWSQHLTRDGHHVATAKL